MTGPGGRGGGRRTGRTADAAVGEKGSRTPEQERRATERARRIRERRAAERGGSTRSSTPRKAEGSGPAAAASTDTTERGRAGAVPAERPAGGDDTARTGDSETGRKTAGRTGGKATRATGKSTPRATGGKAARPSTDDLRYRRRRLVALLVAAAVLLAGLAAAGWWALGRFGPGVDEVQVTGNRTLSTDDVRRAAGIAGGTPLAAVDTGAVQERVAGIPGVATVDVGRGWPHTVTVTVTERIPVAVADAPGGRRMVDATGLAYRTLPPNPPRLPLLQLPRVAPDDPLAVAAVVLLSDLPGPIRDQVEAVAPGAGGSTLELVLTDGRKVLWGRWSDGGDAAHKAAVLGPLLSREGSVYDVSSPQLPTVRR